MSGPEPREPGWSHQLSNCQPFRGPELGWLPDREAPTPRPSLMQKPVHWCPEDLPAPPGLSFYLSLPGTAKCATNCLSLSQHQPKSPTPTTLASPQKHKSGCGGGVGDGFLLMPRYFSVSCGLGGRKTSPLKLLHVSLGLCAPICPRKRS